MKEKDLAGVIADLVQAYIDDDSKMGPDPRIRVNPAEKRAMIVDSRDFADEIEDADEAVENAAAADGMAEEEAMDFQVSENPDFYPMRELVLTEKSGKRVPDMRKIDRIAKKYE